MEETPLLQEICWLPIVSRYYTITCKGLYSLGKKNPKDRLMLHISEWSFKVIGKGPYPGSTIGRM